MKARLIGIIPSLGRNSIPAIAGVLLFMAAGSLQAKKLPGVINCTAGCTLTTPYPDPVTNQQLSQEVQKLNDGRTTVWTAQTRVQTGDVLTVCNGISCVNYTWRGAGFDSGEVISTVLPPNSRGGGGGGGGGGSGPISGGCHGNCGGGKVRVGELEQM